MSILTFKSEDVRRVVEHSLAAPSQGEQAVDYRDGKMITAPVEVPAVLLVHDRGIYLMSNGEPPDLIEAGKDSRFVAYAEGCHPQKNVEWWDTAQALVGGDDFGETLPWAEQIRLQLNLGLAVIRISFTGNSIELVRP